VNDPSDFTEQNAQPLSGYAEGGKAEPAEEPLTGVLRRVADLAKQVIPELTEASVTMIDDTRPRTVVFTGPLALHLDERQYEEGFGPCTDAAATGCTIRVDTAGSAQAYPDFARLAAAEGVTHVLSVGLPVRQRVIGALNLYCTIPAGFSEDSAALAETFAAYGALAVSNLAVHESTTERTQQLETAIRTRAVIEQAKGIVMARQYCTPDEASAVLRRLSISRHERLCDVAARLVAVTQARSEAG
jgi:GAF domain-containing protein